MVTERSEAGDLRMDDLPPPGEERRRLLREHGHGIRRSDFSDEELAQRGISVGDQRGAPDATYDARNRPPT